jgi:signal transduction histidine kinase
VTGPLDHLHSIKLKIGAIIVAAVLVSAGVVVVAAKADLPLWLAGIAAVAIALLMVQFLARGLTVPLRELAQAAHEMAEGRYDRRVYTPSNDEVGELAEAFNRMASELAAVDTERRELIANVSHELRTPISAMQAVMENIVDGVGPADPATMRTMLAQVERLGRLVTQLLDLSRLDARDASLETRSFAVAPLLQAAVDEAKIGAGRPGVPMVRLELSVEPPALEADGDPDRIRQVVANLLDNAISHSPDGGRVAVGARRNGTADSVELEVSDAGPGIPPDEAARVFDRFYRSDSAHSDDGGTGLGLAIARSIVELHGGTIQARNGGERGCRMVVALPGAGAA